KPVPGREFEKLLKIRIENQGLMVWRAGDGKASSLSGDRKTATSGIRKGVGVRLSLLHYVRITQ
ncbi:MAG: hypothetical protein KJ658_03040, partial [Proteobacteria bacterium]|nr:hypothetical protein [Pseudomonadota bacterium]